MRDGSLLLTLDPATGAVDFDASTATRHQIRQLVRLAGGDLGFRSNTEWGVLDGNVLTPVWSAPTGVTFGGALFTDGTSSLCLTTDTATRCADIETGSLAPATAGGGANTAVSSGPGGTLHYTREWQLSSTQPGVTVPTNLAGLAARGTLVQARLVGNGRMLALTTHLDQSVLVLVEADGSVVWEQPLGSQEYRRWILDVDGGKALIGGTQFGEIPGVDTTNARSVLMQL